MFSDFLPNFKYSLDKSRLIWGWIIVNNDLYHPFELINSISFETEIK